MSGYSPGRGQPGPVAQREHAGVHHGDVDGLGVRDRHRRSRCVSSTTTRDRHRSQLDRRRMGRLGLHGRDAAGMAPGRLGVLDRGGDHRGGGDGIRARAAHRADLVGARASCLPGPWTGPRPSCGTGTRRPRSVAAHFTRLAVSAVDGLLALVDAGRGGARSWSATGTGRSAPRPPPPPTRTRRSCCSATPGSASRAWPWCWPARSSRPPSRRTDGGSGGSRRPTEAGALRRQPGGPALGPGRPAWLPDRSPAAPGGRGPGAHRVRREKRDRAAGRGAALGARGPARPSGGGRRAAGLPGRRPGRPRRHQRLRPADPAS